MEQVKENSANRLAERILSDARAQADVTLAEAEAGVDELALEQEKRLLAIRADFEKKRAAAIASVIDGSNTRAAIDGRKAALEKKRVVIEKAFSTAYEKLLQLSDEGRAAILENLLKRELEGGEVIVPAKADRGILESLAKRFADLRITVSDQDAAIDAGCIITGSGYEKDCSFKSILAEVRDSQETAVAKLLFD